MSFTLRRDDLNRARQALQPVLAPGRRHASKKAWP